MGFGGRRPRFVTPSTINPDWPPLGWFEFLRTHSPPMESESTVVHQPSVSLVALATLPVCFGWLSCYRSRLGRSRGRRPRCAAPCAIVLTYRGFLAAADTLPGCLGWIVAHGDEAVGSCGGDGGRSRSRKFWPAGWLFRLSE